MVIEELAAIVAIKAEQGEGQRVFDVFDLLEDVGFSFAPDCSLFGPAGGNIDTVNAVDEHPGQGLAAMGDGIGFEKTRAGFIPLVGLDRDLFSNQRSRFGRASSSSGIRYPSREKESVDGGRGDLEEGLRGLRRQRSEGLHITGEPEGQDDLEAF